MGLIKVLTTQRHQEDPICYGQHAGFVFQMFEIWREKFAKFLNKTGSNCCSHLNRDFPNLTDFIMMGLKCFINELFNVQDLGHRGYIFRTRQD